MDTPIQSGQQCRSLIYEAARRAGFDLCGIAPVELPGSHVEAWRNWLSAGRHGEMRYMRRDERADITRLAPWAKSVICVGLNYWLAEDQRAVPSETISVYAQGHDYHDVMKARMEQLLDSLWRELPGSFEAKIYVDTGPILERAYAQAAGLGWIGKNTCLIHEQRGSFFFLGEILTSLELPPESPAPDRCGTCTACLDACPTGAFIAPYQLDARKCISYQTIELRGAIPEADRPGIGTHIFGCDICQDVCPWNKRSTPTEVIEFLPIEAISGLGDTPLEQLATLSETQFKRDFRGSPLKRPKQQGLVRNVAVALGNEGGLDAARVLKELATSDDSLVASHAEWGLQRISDTHARRSENREVIR